VPAPFFFSYAHNDAKGSPHLDAFFKEVSARVRFLTGAKEDGYRDEIGMRAGEVWSGALASQLNATRVLVALYSPSYFQSRVCARELQVFLERRRRYIRENVGKKPGNIIPVLWQVEPIPRSLPDFHYERPRSEDIKETEGVWFVRDDGRAKEFRTIAYSVAKRVKEASAVELPALPHDPVLEGVTSAFEPEPLPPAEFDPARAAATQCATFVYASPPAWKTWPFSPKSDPLLHIAAAVAKGRDLDAHQLAFDPTQADLLPRLQNARKAHNLLVVLVDGTTLANEAVAGQLRAFDAEQYPSVGTVVVWPQKVPADAHAIVGQVFPKLSHRQPPLFWPTVGEATTFATAVAQSLDRLANDALNAPAPAAAPVVPSSYGNLPSISNEVRA
jgi:TIR domain-containing protein